MPSNPHLILCNGYPRGARRPSEWNAVEPMELITNGNVTLKISDLTDRMCERLPSVVHDLVELAALVYAADQSCRRVRGKTIDWGETWHRAFRFEVQVRDAEFWDRDDVKQALIEGLSFLSGDDYEFEFRRHPNPPSFPEYLQYNKSAGAPDPVEKVILFSGGLDSLTGAVEDILVHGRRIAMVSHKPVDHLAVKQRTLFADIVRRAASPELRPLHYPVTANKAGELDIDHTQRTRSFLYAALAATVARYFGLDKIHFYENGIVSVNLPLCQQEVGTRATRTTHPQSLDWFSRIFGLVIGSQFSVVNEFFWDTKQDVLERLKRSGHAELARDSLSCTHTRGFTNESPHCGVCSQCVSRRVAALGAGYGEDDPSRGYRADVLLAPRPKDEDRILAERFVGTALQIEQMHSGDDLFQSYAGELARVTPYLGLRSSEAVGKLFDLHHRHAVQVGEVMRQQMACHLDARRRGHLDSTCMLNYAFDASQARPDARRQREGSPEPRADGLEVGQLVSIGQPGGACFVMGREKPPLTHAQRAVIKALIEAGEDGLSKDELEAVRPSARRILTHLRRDSDWAQVIVMAGGTNGRYHIRV